MVSVALDQSPGKVKFVPETVGLAYRPTRAELVLVSITTRSWLGVVTELNQLTLEKVVRFVAAL